MTPPINIDGTDITGATIDGADVSEVTVDGTQVFSAIPDSAVLQLNSKNLSEFSDGDVVTTWNAVEGTDGQAQGTGDAIYRESGLNGYPSVEVGSNSFFNINQSVSPQPVTLYAVCNLDDSAAKRGLVSNEGLSTNTQIEYNSNNSEWTLFAGSKLTNNNDTGAQLFDALLDGSSSKFNIDGNETTGDPGANAFPDSIDFGDFEGDSWIGNLAFLEIHDGTPTNGYDNRRQEVADEFDITLP